MRYVRLCAFNSVEKNAGRVTKYFSRLFFLDLLLDEDKDENGVSNNHTHQRRRRKTAVQAPSRPKQQQQEYR
jgi:hypothetical protein